MNLHEARMTVQKSTQDALDHASDTAARVGRGALAGFIGGAIAAYVMNRYAEVENRPVNIRREEAARLSRGEAVAVPVAASLEGDAKVQVAQQVSRKLFAHELSDLEKRAAVPAMHYGYRAAMGAVYGALAEVVPGVGMGLGIPFATLLWVGRDEFALPTLGVSPPSAQVPPQTRASGLASHFVYGMTLDLSRRILRRIL